MKKGFKIEYNFETLQIWEESIEALQLYDPNYVYIMYDIEINTNKTLEFN